MQRGRIDHNLILGVVEVKHYLEAIFNTRVVHYLYEEVQRKNAMCAKR